MTLRIGLMALAALCLVAAVLVLLVLLNPVQRIDCDGYGTIGLDGIWLEPPPGAQEVSPGCYLVP